MSTLGKLVVLVFVLATTTALGGCALQIETGEDGEWVAEASLELADGTLVEVADEVDPSASDTAANSAPLADSATADPDPTPWHLSTAEQAPAESDADEADLGDEMADGDGNPDPTPWAGAEDSDDSFEGMDPKADPDPTPWRKTAWTDHPTWTIEP